MKQLFAISAGVLVLGLLIGLLIGGATVAPKEVIKEVPKIVEKTITVNNTLEKEVSVDYKEKAFNVFFEDLEDNLDKFQEISKIETGDRYIVTFDTKRDKEVIVVEFTVEYNLIDTLTNKRSSVANTVSVEFREDKEPKISLI